MRVAVIGSGGREHSIAWALRRHRPAEDVFVLPGNGGTAGANVEVDPLDFDAVDRFLREKAIDLVIVGPEAPLAAGIVDVLGAKHRGLGPTRAAARLETSKVGAKEFMVRHGVATAEFWSFGGGDDPSTLIRDLKGELVVKYDGLAAGKGVWVCRTVEAAQGAVAELRTKHGADARFIIERLLTGDELSIIGFTDGRTFAALPPSQDHKTLLDGDRGPNTGGMGAFAPVPQASAALLETIEERIIAPTLRGFAAEALDYRGPLYFGVMVTSEGPRLLEYNARFGDPETQCLLPLLEDDLAEVALDCLEGRLASRQLRLAPGFAAGVVLASEGYPGTSPLGRVIEGLEPARGRLLFHAGTRVEQGRHVTSGGRVLCVVGCGDTLEAAIARAYAQAGEIRFEGMQYRTDIGRRTWKLGAA